MFNLGEQVQCKKTGMIGFIEEKEWENGWRYTVLSNHQVTFYREGHELFSVEE